MNGSLYSLLDYGVGGWLRGDADQLGWIPWRGGGGGGGGSFRGSPLFRKFYLTYIKLHNYALKNLVEDQ